MEQVLFVNLFNFHLTLYIFYKIGSFIILYESLVKSSSFMVGYVSFLLKMLNYLNRFNYETFYVFSFLHALK